MGEHRVYPFFFKNKVFMLLINTSSSPYCNLLLFSIMHISLINMWLMNLLKFS